MSMEFHSFKQGSSDTADNVLVISNDTPLLLGRAGELPQADLSHSMMYWVKAKLKNPNESIGGNSGAIDRSITATCTVFNHNVLTTEVGIGHQIIVRTDDAGGPATYVRMTGARISYDAVGVRTKANEPQTNTIPANGWFCMASTLDATTGDFTFYAIDPADGTILYKNIYNWPIPNAPAYPYDGRTRGANNFVLPFKFRRSSNNGTVLNSHTHDMLLAEWDYWEGTAKTEAELVALSQIGFAETNLPQDLVFSINWMRDWRLDGNPTQTDDASGNGNHALITFDHAYSLDNPVPVFLMREASAEHDYVEVGLFSASTGTTRICAYPSGTAQPSDADIFNGVGAVSSIVVQPDGIVEGLYQLSGLDTGTEYELFAIQDEQDLGSYGSVAKITVNTPYKYSETVGNVSGNPWISKTGIQWSWFDSTDTNSLGSASASGTLSSTPSEETDANGLLEITLPTSISTAKGGQGTMVLRADFDGAVQTASHIVTVK